MKLARYSASGSTHRNGTLAMFCVMWLVTASSITEPIAESASHHSWTARAGAAAAASRVPSCAGAPLREDAAVAPQSTTSTAYSADQPQPSCLRSKNGSNRSGKPISASSEAKLESANKRYGTALRNLPQYQAWSSGVVVESRKYGSPI